MNQRAPLDPELPLHFRVGEWAVDAEQNQLRRGMEIRPLRQQAMALLQLLAEQPGRLVPHEEIEQRIWGGNAFVAPKGMANALWTLRQALGDDPEQPRYVQTVAKKGYRLVAAVELLPPPGATAPQPVTPAALAEPRKALRWLALPLAVVILGGAAWLWRPRSQPAEVAPPAPVALQVRSVLTQYPGHEYLGAVSPDGQWLAFTRWQWRGTAALMLRPAASLQAEPQPVDLGGREPLSLAWSPDGRWLAITATQDDRDCALLLLDFASREQRRVAPCTDEHIGAGLAWSPDGRELVFAGTAEGRAGLFAVAPAVGAQPRRLTESKPAAAPRYPVWSADGKQLAYVLPQEGGGGFFVEELTLADGQRRRINAQPMVEPLGMAGGAGAQDWLISLRAQDGAQLFRLQRSSGSLHPLGLAGRRPVSAGAQQWVVVQGKVHVSLASLLLDGRSAAPTPVLSLSHSLSSPAWHAGRQRLAVVSLAQQEPRLLLQDGTGQSAREIATGPGAAVDPSWSPDGRRLAYRGRCKGEARFAALCLMDLDDGSLLQLADGQHGHGPAAWADDGQALWASSPADGPWRPVRYGLDGSRRVLASEPLHARSRVATVGAMLVAAAVDRQRILVLDPASGKTLRAWPTNDRAGETLIDLRPYQGGLLLLQRGEHERFERLDLTTGERRELARYPSGTFAESARFSTDEAQGRVVVTKLNVSDTDLVMVGF